MKKSLIFSVLLHIILLGFLVVDWPFSKKVSHPPMIQVDFVKVGPKTAAPKITKNPAAAPPSDSKKKEKKKIAKPKKMIQKEEIPEVAVEENKPKKEVKDVKKPKEKIPDLKKNKEIEKKKEPKKIKNEAKKNKKIQEEEKREERKKPLKDVKKSKKKNKALNKAHVDLDQEDQSSRKLDKIMDSIVEGEDGVDAEEVSQEVTASEMDAIKQTLSRCWHVPGGIRGAADMAIPVEIWVDADGKITHHKVHAQASSPEMSAAIKSAERAVSDPRCQPLPIPKEKYEQFKNMIMDFNPRNMH